MTRAWKAALAVALVAASVPAGAGPATARATAVPYVAGWPMAGQNHSNTRFAATETLISAGNAARLRPRWTAALGGNVAATPTVSGGTVYVPDYGGKLTALDAVTGAVRWQRPVSDYSGVAGDVSRTSPAIYGTTLVLGDGVSSVPGAGGARVMAATRATGTPLWSTVIDADPVSMVTTSPVVDGTTVYVGTASRAEFGAPGPVTFRGAVVALNAVTGTVLWRRYMAPAGYTGNSVWGSSFVVDHVTGRLFVATGNNYTVPDGVCTRPGQRDCEQGPADNYTDSVVALNLRTGAVEWAFRTLTADVGTEECETCGPDFDFGSAPSLISTPARTILGVGQKSGIYWALDPVTGKEIWHTVVGPGSDLGGIEWGSATDGRRVYVGIGNAEHEEYEITGADGTTTTTDGGSWAALDATTGRILWQVADPYGTLDLGFISAAGGVVFAGGINGEADSMFALDAATGRILWRYRSGGAVIGGAAIVAGTVYWGSGYWFGLCSDGTYACAQNNKLYAFSPA
ncbi:PQQ-binding-like beta-propeller repeat protein [Actinomadura sp. ATCC 31491]|uniref:PQQ-binding-like beta-propeller repeat protein n=1 Tax=Actinomadura luzonensis TaxID=2805427 RepID=A0ABT0FXN8_9ACTN|nr:PQQ-binding-like beta-propeller repeat protein [Actinomadura luzonensis]MCK2217106.1 PQQ-binding-like beta-propeller repeat protein [Actinomadura luzonensis]